MGFPVWFSMAARSAVLKAMLQIRWK